MEVELYLPIPGRSGRKRRHGYGFYQVVLGGFNHYWPEKRNAWALARGRHVLAIPGTGKRAHLEENVAAAEIVLSAADLETLSPAGPAGRLDR